MPWHAQIIITLTEKKRKQQPDTAPPPSPVAKDPWPRKVKKREGETKNQDRTQGRDMLEKESLDKVQTAPEESES